MSFQITTAFVEQFHNNYDLLSQQEGSRLEQAVTVKSIKGEAEFFDQIGATAMQSKTTRHGDTPLVSTPHARRMLVTSDFEWADIIDKADEVKILNTPQSAYMRNAVAAKGRNRDNVITDAMFGTAKTGKAGGTSVTFPAANQVAVNDHTFDSGSGNVGLTVGKLIHARKKILSNKVSPREEFYAAITAAQLSDLLTEDKFINRDYAEKALMEGMPYPFMGLNLILTEELPVDANAYRRVPVWVKSGVLLGKGSEGEYQRITERADKSYGVQLYIADNVGATRMEEVKVIEIKCLES